MSRSKRNNDKIKNKNKKKQMLLKQLKNEITKLEHDIKYNNVTNVKIAMLKLFKIILRTVQLITPYIVAGGIVLGGFSVLGGTPIIVDKRKKKLETLKEIDSFGNVRYEQQYDEYKNTKGKVIHYDKWELTENGLYTRNVKTYLIGEITEETIMNLIENNSISSLNEVFGQPILTQIESRNNLTDEEICSLGHLKGIWHSKDSEDFIIADEPVDENIALTLLCFLLMFISEFIAVLYRDNSIFDYKESLENIKENYTKVDVELLIKKLEIKKDNYNRLQR